MAQLSTLGSTARMSDSLPKKKQAFGWFIPLALFAVIFLLGGFYWPVIDLMTRSTQRQQVLERVQAAGGWGALRRDCAALASTNTGGFSWSRLGHDTNSLPPAIAALRPRRVDFYPHQVYPHGTWWSSATHSDAAVRIFVFGTHNTDGHDQPSLGLDVLCESGVTSYTPPYNWRSDIPLRYWKYRKIADDIYEVY